MTRINIDESRCNGDGLCTKVCPSSCLSLENGKAQPSHIAPKTCIRCGQCMAVCPKMAISLDDDNPAEFTKTQHSVDPTQFENMAKSRRSVRLFKPASVPQADLQHALDVARYAPTGKNAQDVEWVVISGAEKVHALESLSIDILRDMPEGKRLVQNFDAGQTPILRSAPHIILNHSRVEYDMHMADSAIAMTYLELMLYSMGIASCWAGYFMRVSTLDTRIAEYLHLPADRKIQCALMVGYPLLKYQRIPPRKDLRVNWIA